jgi:hypothetical protein
MIMTTWSMIPVGKYNIVNSARLAAIRAIKRYSSSTIMIVDDIDREAELPVSFSPALYLQRRGWVFEIMRRERVTQVCLL